MFGMGGQRRIILFNRTIKRETLKSESLVYSDGLACFMRNSAVVATIYSELTGGGQKRVNRNEFRSVNTMVGNVKRLINGTYYAIPKTLVSGLSGFLLPI